MDPARQRITGVSPVRGTVKLKVSRYFDYVKNAVNDRRLLITSQHTFGTATSRRLKRN